MAPIDARIFRSTMTYKESWLDPKVGFQPTDQQLITFFLKKRISGDPLPMNLVIDEVQFRDFNPIQLSNMYGFANQKELYFFTPLLRNRRNNNVADRKAGDGYWKAISREKGIVEGDVKIGNKRSLKFCRRRSTQTQVDSSMTNYYMTEYNMGIHAPPASALLYEWVLCKVWEKEKGKKAIVHTVGSTQDTAGSGADIHLDLKTNKRRLVVPLSELVSFDIIIEILSWLPVSSLLRFKCVCKQWYSLIGKNKFIAKHMDRASPVRVPYTFTWDPPQMALYYEEHFKYISSSCAGLLLEKSINASQVYRIRNQATRQVLYLPRTHDRVISMGFVLNPTTFEFKVAYNFYCNDGSIGYEVITIGEDDRWRPVQNPYREKAVLKRLTLGGSKMEALHIGEIIKDGQEVHQLRVQSFDIWSECVIINTLPQGLIRVPLDLVKVSVTHFKQALAVAGIVGESLHILALEDFKKHKWSETKVISLKFLKEDPVLKDKLRLISFISKGKIFVFYNGVDKTYVVYDMKREVCGLMTTKLLEKRISSGTYLKSSLVTLEGMRLKS